MVRTKVEICGAEDAPILHIAPANGFPPHTYLPLLRGLGGYRAICLPPRALWGNVAPPSDRRGWRQTADDLLAGFAAYDLRDVVAVGHSFGGIASMLALLDAPFRFKALVMLDPVFFPPAYVANLLEAWERGEIEQHPMVRSVRRRRRIFESREEAYTRFRAKPIFADWSDKSLRIYVEHGLRERAGGSFGLCWDVDWEAYYFSTVYERVWQELARLNGVVPTLIVRASESNTFPYESVAPLRSLLPAADYVELEGQGHLFPLAAPELTARVLREWLGTL